MVTSEIKKLFHLFLFFPTFKRIPFDFLLTSWVTNYAHNRDTIIGL